ncbi:MAG: tetratricopeptide repeat protein, partial [Polyangiaceae bacterium]
NQKWFDLAYQVLDDYDARGQGTPDAQAQAKMCRARLLTEDAGDMKYRKKAKEKIDQARAILQQLATSMSGTPTGADVAVQLSHMSLTEADAAAERMRTTDDPAARDAAHAEAIQEYKDAEKLFSDLMTKYKDASGGDDLYRLVDASYCHGMAVYQLAEITDAPEDRTSLLTQARDCFTEVNFDYTDKQLGVEAGIMLGIVQKELGKFKESLDAFDSAYSMKEFYYNKETGQYNFPDPSLSDIVARAALFKAQTLNDPMHEYQRAIDTAKKLFDVLPSYQTQPLGLLVRCEEAIARGALGDKAGMNKVCDAIIAADPDGPNGQFAARALEIKQGKIGGKGGITMPPDKRLAVAKNKIERGLVVDGMALLRALIADLEVSGGDDATKYLPQAWYALGDALFQQKRYDESSAIFERYASQFPKDPDAARALFYASMGYSHLNGAAPNSYDKDRYTSTLNTLSNNYADDPAAKASAYLLGSQKFEEKDYLGAAKEFEKVSDKAGVFFDAAIFEAGVAYATEARRVAEDKTKLDDAKALFESAQQSFRKAIQWADSSANGTVTEGSRLANLKKIGFRARCRLAETYLQPADRDPAKALEAANSAVTVLGKDADAESIAEARLLIVQSYLESEDVPNAEDAMAKLTAAAPDSQKTARGEREVAIEFDGLCAKARQAGKKAELKDLLGKTANHYFHWAQVARKSEAPVPPEDYARAGDKLFSIAIELNGVPDTASFPDVDDLTKLPARDRFAQAATAYETALATDRLPDAWLVRSKVATCYGFTGDWDKSRAAFEPLIKSEKLLKMTNDEHGKPYPVINPDSMRNERAVLLYGYADYGFVLFELGASDAKYVDEALEALARVVAVVPPGTPLWWRAKYDYFCALYEKGDYQAASIGVSAMQRVNPEFDHNKYGFKDRFLALLAKLDTKQPPSKGGS